MAPGNSHTPAPHMAWPGTLAAARGWLCAASLIVLCAGCAGTPAIDQSDAGKTTSYPSGSRGFDIEAVPAEGDSLSAVDLYLSIPFPSLIFEKTAAGFRSRCELSARLTDRLSGQLSGEVAWAETTIVQRYEATQSFEPVIRMKRIPAPPGSYRVDVTLEDIVNGRRASRAQSVTIWDPALSGPALGRISLVDVRRDGAPVPQISFFVPMKPDSIPCTVKTYDFSTSTDSRVGIRLLRIPGDTNVAIVPYYYPTVALPTGHSLADFGNPDTAYQTEFGMRASRRIAAAEFRIPPLEEGLYRIECLALTQTPGGTDTLLAASRYYSIKGPGFPRPVTYAELIDAAVYIATNREMAVLRSARGPDEQRKRFEEFWLSLAGDPVKAAALIRTYYSRVEEANRLFTNIKEGWRTDRGMLYCVLGPPAEITNRLDNQSWYYDLSGNAAENLYVFKHVTRQAKGLTVEDYLLYRQSVYEMLWGRMIFKWRNGEIL